MYKQLNSGPITLSRANNPEGYVAPTIRERGDGIDASLRHGMSFCYYIKDHLGNIREVYSSCKVTHVDFATLDDDGNPMVINQYNTPLTCTQRTQYYPSGLPWRDCYHADEQPIKYNSKEFVEMHGLDEYDSKARWYYPAIMRTTTMDPLCEKYYDISPYAWCGNNPINYVDPDGRDIWELTDDGTIKARIIDKTQDAIALRGKSISFDYGTIDRGHNGKERDDRKFTYFQFAEGKENEAAGAFKFLADNSNVEYALVNTDKGVSSVYTNHMKNEVLTGMAATRVEKFSGAKMTDNYHSHTNGTMFPSGLKEGTRDIRFARNKGDSYGFYIYPTKSNSVIEYFSNGSYINVPQPWPYTNAGTISPYVRQSGIPALLRKIGIKL